MSNYFLQAYRLKQKFLLLVAALLPVVADASTNTLSQGDGRFSLAVEPGIPIGHFGTQQGFCIGATFRNEAPIGNFTAMMFTAGYIYLTSKTASSFSPA